MRALLFAGLALAATGHAAVVDFYWNITQTLANPDGLFERTVVGVNNSWPPPPLVVTQGDTIRMHAINGLDTYTTLHHHGMYFNGTTYFDGALGVTQCGIPPGETLVYEVNTTIQVGTYWVHAHSQGQYMDGLRAPVAILPQNRTATYDEDYTIIISDWYHQQHSELAAQFLSKANPGGAEPIPDSALIYIAQNPNGTYLPGFNENASLPMTPGKTYRLRVVNVGGFAMFFFKISGHQMTVIEVDGTDVHPYSTDTLTVTVAQRYSVLVTALNSTQANYQIQANFDADMFDAVPDGLPLNYTAAVTYDNNAQTAPATDFEPWQYTSMNDTELVPVQAEPILQSTHSIELNVFFSTFKNGVNRAAFNNITYVSPLVPTVMTVDSMGPDVVNPAIYGRQSHALVLGHMDVVELRVVNWDAGKHPFHLHGHKFQIVGRQEDVTIGSPEVDNDQPNPIRRDTVQIPSGGSATLRFVADNPGVWLFHCHIDWHLTSGLAVTMIEAPLQMQQTMRIPQVMRDHCAALNQPSAGNAAGKLSATDLSGAPDGPYPQDPGFHAAGAGAIAACVLSALLGVATLVWYAMGEYDEDGVEWEEQRKVEAKAAGEVKAGAGGGVAGLLRGVLRRVKGARSA